LAADVRVMLRRRANRNSGASIPQEMVILRDGAILAVLRDDEPLGSTLIRLSRLSEPALCWAVVALDASLIREHPFVRDVLLALIEDRMAARRDGAPGGTRAPAGFGATAQDACRGFEVGHLHVPRRHASCADGALTTTDRAAVRSRDLTP
jgi:hypothetical protein